MHLLGLFFVDLLVSFRSGGGGGRVVDGPRVLGLGELAKGNHRCALSQLESARHAHLAFPECSGDLVRIEKQTETIAKEARPAAPR